MLVTPPNNKRSSINIMRDPIIARDIGITYRPSLAVAIYGAIWHKEIKDGDREDGSGLDN